MTIALKRATATLSLFLFLGTLGFAQKIQVTGKVNDASTGEPIPGAAIMVKQGTGGVITH